MCLGTFTSEAQAQGWLEDRDRLEGAGIRLGNFELHPGVGAEVGYDDNLFYEDVDPVSSVIFRVTPHLDLSTLTDSRLSEGEGGDSDQPSFIFRGGIQASYVAFLASEANNNVSLAANADATLNNGRPFSLQLRDTFQRTIRPFAERGARDGNYVRDTNSFSAIGRYSSKSNVLSVSLGYDFGLDFFEGASFSSINNMSHGAQGQILWRFLPQTALVYQMNLTRTIYTLRPERSAALLSNSNAFQSLVGVNGAITQAVGLSALVGYGAGFYDDADDYESIVGQLEGYWNLSDSTRWSLGYNRSFFNAYVGSFGRQDRFYTNFQMFYGGFLMFRLQGSVGLFDFGPVVSPNGDPIGTGGDAERSDVRAILSGFVEYRLFDGFALTGNLRYVANFTDFEFNQQSDSGVVFADPAEFTKLEAWLGVRAFY